MGDRNSGALAIVDTSNNRHIGDIKTDARPGGITFEKSGPRIFVNLNGLLNSGYWTARSANRLQPGQSQALKTMAHWPG